MSAASTHGLWRRCGACWPPPQVLPSRAGRPVAGGTNVTLRGRGRLALLISGAGGGNVTDFKGKRELTISIPGAGRAYDSHIWDGGGANITPLRGRGSYGYSSWGQGSIGYFADGQKELNLLLLGNGGDSSYSKGRGYHITPLRVRGRS